MDESAPCTVLITGCSSGFGRLTAETLAAAGHRVFASMRRTAGDNAAAAAALRAFAEEKELALEVVDLDVTDDASVHRAVETVMATAGAIDVVVNNAGIAAIGILEAFPTPQVKALFEVNTFGPLRLDRAVLPAMRARGRGLLIHISSASGRICAPPLMGAYCASKFALEALVEALHFELAGCGIDAVVIEPGAYVTDLQQNMQRAADEGVAAAYGELASLPETMFQSVGARLSGPDAPDPRQVAEAVQRLIALPSGQRPLRTVVGPVLTEGLAAFEQAYEQTKAQVFATLDLPAPDDQPAGSTTP